MGHRIGKRPGEVHSSGLTDILDTVKQSSDHCAGPTDEHIFNGWKVFTEPPLVILFFATQPGYVNKEGESIIVLVKPSSHVERAWTSPIRRVGANDPQNTHISV